MFRRHAALLACLGLAVYAASVSADEADDQFNFATGLLIKNEPALAADEFQALLAKHPAFKQADVALYRLGEARQKAGDAAGARAAFERLVKEFPDSARLPAAHYWLAQLVAPTDPAAAARHYAEVATRWPDDPLSEAARYGRAEELFKAEDWPGAVAACDVVIAKHPDGKYVAPARYSRAWAQYKAGDWTAALASFQAFVEKHGTHEFAPECRGKAAECLRKLGRREEALAAYAALCDVPGAVGRDARVGRAYVLFELQRMPAAAEAFQAAAEVLTEDPRRPACLLNAGHAWFAAGQFQPAADVWARIGREHAADLLAPVAAFWHASALVKLGQFDDAAAALRALKDDPRLKDLGVEARMTLAEAFAGQKDFAAAATAYDEAARLRPDHALADDAAVARVFALEKAGDLAGAEQAAVACVAAHGGSDLIPPVRFAIGEYRFRQKRFAEAAEAFEQFVKALPGHALEADAHYKLGWCAREQQLAARARDAFAVVVARHADSPLAAESAFRCGQAAETLGDAAGAAAAYADAVRLGGDGPFAQQAALAATAQDLSAQRYEDALKRASDLERLFPKSAFLPFARLYAGEALLELGRHEEALAAYGRVGDTDAAAAIDAAFGMGWTYRRMRRPADAIAIFDRVAAGGSARAAEAAFHAARSREEAEQFAAAQAGYAAVAADGAQPEARRAEADYRQALCAYRARQLIPAGQLYETVLKQRPEGPFAAQALYDLAWVLLEQQKPVDAETRFRELLARFPTHALVADVHFRLGELAYDRGDFTASATAYQAALRTPDAAFADKVLYKLGWALERAEQNEAALAVFARIPKEHPGSDLVAEAGYRQGRLLRALARYDEAVLVLEKVPDGAFAEKSRLLLGECQRAAGRHKEALEAYASVLTRWPEGECRVSAQLGRGHSLRAVGANQDAIEAYAAVVQATDSVDAAQAVLGQGYAHFALSAWNEAAKAFLKVDILYAYDELKPEALTMLAKTWDKAGEAEKASKYRAELAQRYPNAKVEP